MLLEIGIAFRMGKGLFTRWIYYHKDLYVLLFCEYFYVVL